MSFKSHTQKITVKDLSLLLNVSYKTALKDYNNFIHILELKRDFLIKNDLIKLKILE